MTSWTVCPIELGDTDSIGALNELAFANDQFMRLMRPARLRNPDITDAERAKVSGDMICSELQAHGARRLAHKIVSDTGEVIGFSVWSPPKYADEKAASEGNEQVKRHESSAEIRAERDMEASKRFHDVYVPLEKAHVPGPHWELMRLATRPGFERQGIASTLLHAGLEEIDRRNTGLPCLICATPQGKGLYERFGFLTVADEVQEEEQDEYGQPHITSYPWSLLVRQ